MNLKMYENIGKKNQVYNDSFCFSMYKYGHGLKM